MNVVKWQDWWDEQDFAVLNSMQIAEQFKQAFYAGRSCGLMEASDKCRTAKLSFYRDRIIEIGESDLIDMALLDVARQIEKMDGES